MTFPPEVWRALWMVGAVALGITAILLIVGLSMPGHPWRAAMRRVPGNLVNAARLDGAGGIGRFWHVTLPYAGGGLAAGALGAFAHTLGVMGCVVMLAASFPAGNTLPAVSRLHIVEGLDIAAARGLGALLMLLWLVLTLCASAVGARGRV